MNEEYLKEFYEQIGYAVIKSESCYWVNMWHKFYLAIPPSKVIGPSPEEVAELFKKYSLWGLKYNTSKNNIGKESYLYSCYDKSYNISNLGYRTRKSLRKALKNCQVELIDFDYLKEHGLPLNIDTLKRQRRHDVMLTDPRRWAQFCQAGKETPGAEAWAAMVQGKLAAYLIGFRVGDVYELLYFMSKSTILPLYPNYSVLYSVMFEVLNNRAEINCVCGGVKSLRELPGVAEYKLRMGFVKEPVNFVVVLSAWLRPFLLNKATGTTLKGMLKLFPQNDVLKRMSGLLAIAQRSNYHNQE